MLKYTFIVALALGCGGSQDKPAVPPSNLPISIDQARTVALGAVPGQVERERLDSEDGRWIYEFGIRPTTIGAPKQEVEVDATTGLVLELDSDD